MGSDQKDTRKGEKHAKSLANAGETAHGDAYIEEDDDQSEPLEDSAYPCIGVGDAGNIAELRQEHAKEAEYDHMEQRACIAKSRAEAAPVFQKAHNKEKRRACAHAYGNKPGNGYSVRTGKQLCARARKTPAAGTNCSEKDASAHMACA